MWKIISVVVGHNLDKMKVCIVVSLIVVSVTSFPNGAPPSACVSMIPKHGVSAQNSQSPYLITALRSGNNVMVKITAKPNDTFAGFFIQARDMSSMPVGYFASLDPMVQTIGCIGGMKNAATHNSRAAKTNVTIFWNPPANGKDVNFTLTIVRSTTVFWVNQILPYKINSTSPKEGEETDTDEVVLQYGENDHKDTGYVVGSSTAGSSMGTKIPVQTTKATVGSTEKPVVVSVPSTTLPKSDATLSMHSTALIFVLAVIQRYLL